MQLFLVPNQLQVSAGAAMRRRQDPAPAKDQRDEGIWRDAHLQLAAREHYFSKPQRGDTAICAVKDAPTESRRTIQGLKEGPILLAVVQLDNATLRFPPRLLLDHAQFHLAFTRDVVSDSPMARNGA